MNDKLKKLALNRKVESRSICNTMHVILLICNGACNVNKEIHTSMYIMLSHVINLH